MFNNDYFAQKYDPDYEKRLPLRQRLLLRKNRYIPALAAAAIICFLALTIGRNQASYAASAVFVVLTLTYLIFNKYANTVLFTVDCYITICLGLIGCLSVLIILPLDAANAIVASNEGNMEENKIQKEKFKTFWQVVYWPTLAISVIVFNAQSYYHSQGHIKLWSKIKATIKVLLFWGGICVGVVIALFLVLKFVVKLGGVNALIAVIMLGVNVYGITILVVLFGIGLIQLPLYLWAISDPNRRLQDLLVRTERYYDQYRETKNKLNENCIAVRRIIEKIPPGHPLYVYRERLIAEIPDDQEIREGALHASSVSMKRLKDQETREVSLRELESITEDSLASARYRLNRSLLEYFGKYNKWKTHIEEIFDIADPLCFENAKSVSKGDAKDALDPSVLYPREVPLYKVIGMKALAVTALVFSLLVIYSETALIFPQGRTALVFYKMVQYSSNYGGLIFFFFGTMCYVIGSAYFALFRLDLGAFFHLLPFNSHHLALMYCVKNCIGIVFPLCYNICLIFGQISTPEEQALNNKNGPESQYSYQNGFDLFFYPMKQVPFFGGQYNKIVTVAISAVAFFSLFACVRKIVMKVSRRRISFSEDTDQEGAARGGQLILKEWQRRQTNARFVNILARKPADSITGAMVEMQATNSSTAAAAAAGAKGQYSMDSTYNLNSVSNKALKQNLVTSGDSSDTESNLQSFSKIGAGGTHRTGKGALDGARPGAHVDGVKVVIEEPGLEESPQKKVHAGTRNVAHFEIQKARQHVERYFYGWVYKKANATLARHVQGWVRKYMEFDEGYLSYYDDEQKREPEKIPEADLVRATIYNEDPRKSEKRGKEDNTVFLIYTKDREYKFKTDSEQETRDWVSFLNQLLGQY